MWTPTTRQKYSRTVSGLPYRPLSPTMQCPAAPACTSSSRRSRAASSMRPRRLRKAWRAPWRDRPASARPEISALTSSTSKTPASIRSSCCNRPGGIGTSTFVNRWTFWRVMCCRSLPREPRSVTNVRPMSLRPCRESARTQEEHGAAGGCGYSRGESLRCATDRQYMIGTVRTVSVALSAARNGQRL
jgi:hypothetical protein